MTWTSNTISGKYPCRLPVSPTSQATFTSSSNETTSITTNIKTKTMPTTVKDYTCAEFGIDYQGNVMIELDEIYSYFQCLQMCWVLSPVCKGWVWYAPYCRLLG